MGRRDDFTEELLQLHYIHHAVWLSERALAVQFITVSVFLGTVPPTLPTGKR